MGHVLQGELQWNPMNSSCFVGCLGCPRLDMPIMLFVYYILPLQYLGIGRAVSVARVIHVLQIAHIQHNDPLPIVVSCKFGDCMLMVEPHNVDLGKNYVRSSPLWNIVKNHCHHLWSILSKNVFAFRPLVTCKAEILSVFNYYGSKCQRLWVSSSKSAA